MNAPPSDPTHPRPSPIVSPDVGRRSGEASGATIASPAALTRGMADALEECVARGVIDRGTLTPEAYIAAAASLADRMLRGDCESRHGALGLLVIDALVTYAFELAGDQPTEIEPRAGRAMTALAALATAAGRPATAWPRPGAR